MNIPARNATAVNERDARNIRYVQKTQNLTIDDLSKQMRRKSVQSECDDTNRTLKRLHDIVNGKSSHTSSETRPESSRTLQSRRKCLDTRESVDSTV